MNEVSIEQVRKELESFEKIYKDIVWKWLQDERILNSIADDYNDLKNITLIEYLALLLEMEIYDKN